MKKNTEYIEKLVEKHKPYFKIVRNFHSSIVIHKNYISGC